MDKASRNERRKITATAANNLAVSLIVTGVIVPVVSLGYQLELPAAGYWYVFALTWVATGSVLHLISRHLLGRMEE